MWEYQNGNVTVRIDDDGTKTLQCDGVPDFEFPTQLDIKLTNQCYQECSFCHENSHRGGDDGDMDNLMEVLDDLPAGIELALGGGDILKLGDTLVSFLQWCKQKDFIASITIHLNSYVSDKSFVHSLIDQKLIYGLGISIPNTGCHSKQLLDIKDYPHLVLHAIAGIHSVDTLEDYLQAGFGKILILGYKENEYSKSYLESMRETFDTNLIALKRHLYRLFFKGIIIFDNSAIDYLQIDRFFTKEGFQQLYMGNESSHSMFIDAVKGIYCPCSASPRDQGVPFEETSLINYFQTIKTTF